MFIEPVPSSFSATGVAIANPALGASVLVLNKFYQAIRVVERPPGVLAAVARTR